MQKILIVEDDEKLQSELEIFLKNNGYDAVSLKAFDKVVQDILAAKADLVLLDIGLPFVDGEYICKEVRKQSLVPIIIVTSRNNEIDELMSLNSGADQYVTKPYNIRILLAKIEGLLKRNSQAGVISNTLECGEYILNISNSTIEKNGKKVELTKNEFKILYYLTRNKGKIVPREELMDYLWESESFIDDNTLAVNVKRLRAKMSELELQDLVETKRGQGYILK